MAHTFVFLFGKLTGVWFVCVCPGKLILSPGEAVGKGLTPDAARELGLPAGIAVAASLIDAHAGGLGTVSWVYCSWTQELFELISESHFCHSLFSSCHLL